MAQAQAKADADDEDPNADVFDADAPPTSGKRQGSDGGDRPSQRPRTTLPSAPLSSAEMEAEVERQLNRLFSSGRDDVAFDELCAT